MQWCLMCVYACSSGLAGIADKVDKEKVTLKDVIHTINAALQDFDFGIAPLRTELDGSVYYVFMNKVG